MIVRIKSPSQLPAEITQSAFKMHHRIHAVTQTRTLPLWWKWWVCVISIPVNWQQMANNNQDKDRVWPLPLCLSKDLVLPWWLGWGTCLPLLSCILQGQPHTPLEVRCHQGISLGSPFTSFQPVTPTNTETNWEMVRVRWQHETKHLFPPK